MSGPDLRIPAGDGTPQLDIHVNLIYDPYHYLVREGMKETSHRSEVMVHAVEWAGSECEPPGVHGLWDQWEVPMASGATLGEAVTGLRSRMNHAVDTVATALQEAETEYRERVWPRRRPAFEMALLTLDEVLAPYIVEMAPGRGARPDLAGEDRCVPGCRLLRLARRLQSPPDHRRYREHRPYPLRNLRARSDPCSRRADNQPGAEESELREIPG